jgi:hypothetical protein
MRLCGGELSGKARLVDNVAQRGRYLGAEVERFPYTTPSGRPEFLGER